ncbi:MAG: alfa-L-rhamnosidase, partial [Firmicutes bacterium]|nr:alfa-L-rhamnosidase [Bacillota bacterium]
MNGLVIKEFTVEYRTGGIGLDVEAPVFSWKLVSGRQNTVQNSYRLRVSGGGLLYDTGTVESGQSVCVPYAGGKLVPQTEYRAEAEATDNHGDRAFASLTFETGLMAENFTAEFISADCENAPACFEVFKTFTVKKKVLK